MTPEAHEPAGGTTMARFVTMLCGAWLAYSVILWPHTGAQRVNTWIVAALCFLFAAVALRVPVARWLNAALAVWVFISASALPHASAGTVWNGRLMALTIFLMSLIPNGDELDDSPGSAVA